MRILLLMLSALLCFGQPPKPAVVVISLDGFPAYALEDPRLPIPTLRTLAAQGATARSMTTCNPSVTWPAHTTMVTGVPPARHGVLFNGLLIGTGASRKIEPWRDKAELVRVQTVYDLAHRAGLTTAHVDWVPTQNAGTLTWEFPEIPSAKGAIEREMIAAGVITENEIAEFRQLPTVLKDHYWTAAAVHILTRHKPNLLLVHLLNQDATHHRYSARSPAATTSFAYADSRVRAILDALTNATVLIVSDHGFKTVRKNIAVPPVPKVQVIPEGGTAMLYAADPQLIPVVKERLRGVEGIERVVEPAGYAALGLPTPQENSQMADLLLVAKDGYAFTGAVAPGSTPGSHGYLNTDPEMDAIFIAWGRGIRAGLRLDRISNLDVAPTIAALLGLKMENVAGQVLKLW